MAGDIFHELEQLEEDKLHSTKRAQGCTENGIRSRAGVTVMEQPHDEPMPDVELHSAEAEVIDPHQKGLFILVVEDDEETAHTTAALLQSYGHEVQLALDGATALRAAQEHPPDVVLLDIGLPELDGYEVAKLLYRRLPHARRPLLIAVTGLGQAEDCRRSYEAGIDLHLVKPLDPGQLLGVLSRFQQLMA
jgi:CheY-like chemotaxis protein